MISLFNRSKQWPHWAASPLLMVVLYIITNEDSQKRSTHGNRLVYFPMRKAKGETGKVLAKIVYDGLDF